MEQERQRLAEIFTGSESAYEGDNEYDSGLNVSDNEYDSEDTVSEIEVDSEETVSEVEVDGETTVSEIEIDREATRSSEATWSNCDHTNCFRKNI